MSLIFLLLQRVTFIFLKKPTAFSEKSSWQVRDSRMHPNRHLSIFAQRRICSMNLLISARTQLMRLLSKIQISLLICARKSSLFPTALIRPKLRVRMMNCARSVTKEWKSITALRFPNISENVLKKSLIQSSKTVSVFFISLHRSLYGTPWRTAIMSAQEVRLVRPSLPLQPVFPKLILLFPTIYVRIASTVNFSI